METRNQLVAHESSRKPWNALSSFDSHPELEVS